MNFRITYFTGQLYLIFIIIIKKKNKKNVATQSWRGLLFASFDADMYPPPIAVDVFRPIREKERERVSAREKGREREKE